MNHSIDFYVTADENKIADMENASRVISSRGAVKLRVHSSEMSSSSGQAYLKSYPEGFADSRMARMASAQSRAMGSCLHVALAICWPDM